MQHDRSDPDQTAVLDDAALEVDEVAEYDTVAHLSVEFVRGVQHTSILYRGALADNHRSIVTTDDRGWPHRTAGTNGDVTDHRRVRMDVGIRVDLGDEVAECVDGHGRTVNDPNTPGKNLHV